MSIHFFFSASNVWFFGLVRYLIRQYVLIFRFFYSIFLFLWTVTKSNEHQKTSLLKWLRSIKPKLKKKLPTVDYPKFKKYYLRKSVFLEFLLIFLFLFIGFCILYTSLFGNYFFFYFSFPNSIDRNQIFSLKRKKRKKIIIDSLF